MVDHGPSRFSIWRQLRLQTAACVVQQLESVFYERGAPHELLLDNDTAFRSKCFRSFAEEWRISLRFRCAYVASGNGIVERCHRTVKTIAARKECSIAEAVYRYNMSPRDESPCSTPASVLYRYNVRVKDVDCSEAVTTEQDAHSRYSVGDDVWVKPPPARCDTVYGTGRVTGILSEQAVKVDRTPRHVRDLRPRMTTEDERKPTEEMQGETEEWLIGLRNPDEPAQGGDDITERNPDQGREEAPEREIPRRSGRERRPVVHFCCK